MKTVILGAGLTGMAAGIKTGAPIYEAEGVAGGICRSYRKDGFEFSCGGGHWLFGENKAIDFVRTLLPLKDYDRRAGIYYNKIFPYPIQTFSERLEPRTPGFFKDWLGKKFTNEMCNMFFFPFNEKYTAGLYDEVIQFDAYKTPPAGGVGFASKFHDPVGGLSTLVDAMAARCDIRYNKKAIGINPREKVIFLNDSTTVEYDRLVSTIPLDQMLKICGRINYELPYSSVFVLNIGAEPGPNLPNEHWMYIPFCNSGFYRVGFYTNVGGDKAPSGKVGLSVEMAYRDTIKLDVEIIKELQSWGWIGKVITSDETFVRHAYTWNRTADERERHLKWLADRDIISTGRYGLWKFQGMAEGIMQGLSQ